MKSKIGEYFLKVKKIYKINRLGCNILEKARLVEKLFTTKFKRVDYDKIRSSVAMLIVYMDYSSNYYIFLYEIC